MAKAYKKIGILRYLLFVFPAICWFFIFKKDKEHNEERCRTVKMELKGIITNAVGKAGYSSIRVNSGAFVEFDVSVTYKYRKLFGKYHYYQIGDSVIKQANSKDVTIKNGDSICVLTLICDD